MYNSVRNRSNSAQKRTGQRKPQNNYAPSSSLYSNVMSPARVNNFQNSTNTYSHYLSNNYTPSPVASRQNYHRQAAAAAASTNGHRNGQAPLEHEKILAELFKLIATEESLIEHQRQQLAINNDFVAQRVFQTIISEEDQKTIDAAQLLEFLSNNNLQAEMTDTEDIVKEFDGTLDKKLNQDEFLQMILPAANNNVRQLALNRGQNSRDDQAQQTNKLPFNVLGQILNIVEKEINLQRKRNSSKRELLKQQDFSTRKAFQKISRNYHSICMPDLLAFLESNGFYARREDIEAILRRCDHDGNQMISFEEFQELAGVSESSNDDTDDFAMNGAQKDRSPERKDLQQTTEQEKSMKKSNSNEAFVREDMEQAADRKAREEAEQARELKRQQLEDEWRARKEEEELRIAQAEAERKIRQEEQRQEALRRQVDHFMFLRLIKYLLESHKQNEAKKELLYNDVSFSAANCFAVFDQENRGYILEEDFDKALGEHNLALQDVEGLFELLDVKKDEKIYFNEFAEAVTPHRMMDYRQARSSGYGSHYAEHRGAYYQSQGNDELKKIKSQAWIESVVKLLDQLVNSKVAFQLYKEEMNLDANLLFDEIDDYKMGHVSSSHLRRWIMNNCNYNVPEEDIFVLQRALDINDDYKITREEFVKSVGSGDSSETNNHKQQANICTEEVYIQKLESQLKLQQCDYDKYFASIRQFGNLENLSQTHLLMIRDNIKLDQEQFNKRRTAQWHFYNQYYSVQKLNAVAWLLCKHKSDESKRSKLNSLVDPSLNGNQINLNEFYKKEFLYISLNFSEKLVRSQPDSAEKKAALSYLKELRKNSHQWQMNFKDEDFSKYWTQSGIRQGINNANEEYNRKQIEIQKRRKEAEENGIEYVETKVYNSDAANVMRVATASQMVSEYQIMDKACKDEDVINCFDHFDVPVPNDADEFDQLINEMEQIPENEDTNHEFYQDIQKHLTRIRSELEGERKPYKIKNYNPDRKSKTGISKVDGEYVVNQ